MFMKVLYDGNLFDVVVRDEVDLFEVDESDIENIVFCIDSIKLAGVELYEYINDQFIINIFKAVLSHIEQYNIDMREVA